eukprot:6211457-Pleurochrysis_carterae.AAC.1
MFTVSFCREGELRREDKGVCIDFALSLHFEPNAMNMERASLKAPDRRFEALCRHMEEIRAEPSDVCGVHLSQTLQELTSYASRSITNAAIGLYFSYDNDEWLEQIPSVCRPERIVKYLQCRFVLLRLKVEANEAGFLHLLWLYVDAWNDLNEEC